MRKGTIILCGGFLLKPSHGGFGNFLPTGTYAGIGATCVKFENVMISAMKKKLWALQKLLARFGKYQARILMVFLIIKTKSEITTFRSRKSETIRNLQI